MPYIRDPDFARLIEIMEAIKDFAEKKSIQDHAKRALGILINYKGGRA